MAAGTGTQPPLGLCRARHAAVEASILASRLRWLGAEHVSAELARLQGLVDKTAGPRERAAMDYVRRYVAAANVTEVVVTAPARLHFGMLDPAGLGARRFGGCGVGVESPRVVIGGQVRGPADGHRARTAGRARRRRSLAAPVRPSASAGGIEVDVREAIPPHVGLGSGTKLGLAVARGVAELVGRPGRRRRSWREASGRGARSSVGCWTFAAPGLVVEAGVRGEGWISPLVARHPMPDRWRCVLALPIGVEGLSGDAEERFFRQLHERAAGEPRVSRLLLTALLPGLLTEDIDEFGAALSGIQREIGSMFAARQGGVFHPRAAPVVEALVALGVGAVGQSSWGPSVYGIVDSPERAADVADRLRAGGGRRHRRSAWSTSTAAARGSRARLGTGSGMRLLVSVVSAEEARRALAGGADIIDVKDPARRGRSVRRRRVSCPRWCGRWGPPLRSAWRSVTCPASPTPRRWPRAARRSAAPATSRLGCGGRASSTPPWR